MTTSRAARGGLVLSMPLMLVFFARMVRLYDEAAVATGGAMSRQ